MSNDTLRYVDGAPKTLPITTAIQSKLRNKSKLNGFQKSVHLGFVFGPVLRMSNTADLRQKNLVLF